MESMKLLVHDRMLYSRKNNDVDIVHFQGKTKLIGQSNFLLLRQGSFQ